MILFTKASQAASFHMSRPTPPTASSLPIQATSTTEVHRSLNGLDVGLITVCIVLLIVVILAIIIILRMKRKIQYLQTINYSTHGGEVLQEFEMKMEDDLYDNLHDKKENVNEYRNFHEKKEKNRKQPPILPERRNPMDVIISPNSLVESVEAEVQDILHKYKAQGSDDDDTGDIPNLAALPESEELKTPANDSKGSSTKTVKFDNSVTVYSNELEDIKDQEKEEKETEFNEKVDTMAKADVDLSSYDDANVGEPGLYEEYDNENKLHEIKSGKIKVLKENECDDEEDTLYESYDESIGKNIRTTKYTKTIPKKPLNSKEKGKHIPPNDDDMIEEFVYEENQSAEIDPKYSDHRDVLSKNAKALQQMKPYDEALYEEPVSSNFRDSGLPNCPAPNIPKHAILTMTLESKSGNDFKVAEGMVHSGKGGLSEESIVRNKVSESGESDQKAERSKSDITASGASPVPPIVPKRKGKVAPKSSVSPSEGKAHINTTGNIEKNKTKISISENFSGNELGDLGDDNLGFDYRDVPSIQSQTVTGGADGLRSAFDQKQTRGPLTKSSSGWTLSSNSSDA